MAVCLKEVAGNLQIDFVNLPPNCSYVVMSNSDWVSYVNSTDGTSAIIGLTSAFHEAFALPSSEDFGSLYSLGLVLPATIWLVALVAGKIIGMVKRG